MRISKIKRPDAKAEGLFFGHPYNTELASIDGVRFHVWLGDDASDDLAAKLARWSTQYRDVVAFTYSDGMPAGFWAREDVPSSQSYDVTDAGGRICVTKREG